MTAEGINTKMTTTMNDPNQLLTWFNSLSLLERKGRVQSFRDFFDKNTGQLLKIVRNMESTTNFPTDTLATTKQLIANNMKMVNTLDMIENGVIDAEKKISIETIETLETASTER